MKVKLLNEYARLPSYGSLGAAGMDFYLPCQEVVPPHTVVKVPLGIAVEIPEGHQMTVRPRSGLAAELGNYMVTGTVESDYRGELTLILVNNLDHDMIFEEGDRIAQGIVSLVYQVPLTITNTLSFTRRGHGGFGSTGR